MHCHSPEMLLLLTFVSLKIKSIFSSFKLPSLAEIPVWLLQLILHLLYLENGTTFSVKTYKSFFNSDLKYLSNKQSLKEIVNAKMLNTGQLSLINKGHLNITKCLCVVYQ